MSATNVYDVGDDVVLHAAFTSATSGAAILPATVVCRVANGNGSLVATYIFGQGTLVAVGSGVFEVNQPIASAQGWGHWHARFESSTPNGAEPFTFYVRDPAPFS